MPSHLRGYPVRTEGISLRSPRQSQTVSKVLWERESVSNRVGIHVATPVKVRVNN